MEIGKKVLFALNSSGRYGREGKISEEDISLAKRDGYLFDYPKYESHEDTLKRLRETVAQIDPADVANAFLYSLSTRKLEYRSALGSYYYAKAIPEHELMKSMNEQLAAMEVHCYLCGWSAWRREPRPYDQGLNVYSYYRYKYGGLGLFFTKLNYALFDLEQFIKLPKVTPTDEDKRILTEILSCVGHLKGSDKAGKLREIVTKAKIIKSNKDEVSVLLSALGICGILASEDYPAYDVYFADEYERSPAEHTNDFAYPVNRWHARDGVNAERVKEIFGADFLT